MDFPLVAAVSTFLIFTLASTAVFLYLSSRKTIQTWRRRADGQSTSAEDTQAAQGLVDQAEVHIRALLEWFAKFNTPSNIDEMRATKRMLINAGYRSAKAPILYTGAKLLLATMSVIIVAAIPAKVLGFPSTNTLLFYYLLAATCGYYIPSAWLKKGIANRQDTLQHAIPDALDLMVVCVEAGLGLDQAMARVAAEIYQTHPTLGDELTVLGLELRAGVQRQDALRNLAQRTNLDDVKNLVALLVQTDRFGTSIGQALRVHADAMRMTRRLKAEELAAKLPVKLLLPLIFFIFPCMFIVTIGPAVIKIVKVLFPAFAGQ
jgi:tight adherence protein C